MDDASPPESIDQSKEKKKSRRPANTAFRQQRLKAWQPILTPKTVIPLFFVIGIITAPIGGLLIYASATVKELRIDYSDCAREAPVAPEPATKVPDNRVFPSFSGKTDINAQWQAERDVEYQYTSFPLGGLTRCKLTFTVPEDMQAPVLLYYRLENFYQNHRRYVMSFYADQLLGRDVNLDQVRDSACSPLTTTEDGAKAYYPCGLIANSMFNDTIGDLVRVGVDGGREQNTYAMKNTSIAWASDKELYGRRESQDFSGIAPPPNWQTRYPDGGNYTQDAPPPNLQDDEHFIVWMRTAGLPTFSKLNSRNDDETLVSGQYSLDIIDNFRMDVYQGRKSLVLTTTSLIGGKNDFLGILWLVVGGFCIALALVFLVTNFVKPRKLGDHTYLSWNNAPPSAAAKGKGKAAAPPPSASGVSTGRDLA